MLEKINDLEKLVFIFPYSIDNPAHFLSNEKVYFREVRENRTRPRRCNLLRALDRPLARSKSLGNWEDESKAQGVRRPGWIK